MNKVHFLIGIISLTLLSCGKADNGAKPVASDQEVQISSQKGPFLNFTIKDQDEQFYITGDTKKLRIIMSPINQNKAIFKKIVHQRKVFLNINSNPRFIHSYCSVIETRATGFNLTASEKLISPKEIELSINDQKLDLVKFAKVTTTKKETILIIDLPQERRDYFIKLRTLVASTIYKKQFNAQECENIITKDPFNLALENFNLKTLLADDKDWVTYNVDIYPIK